MNWETDVEVDNAGFNLWRCDKVNGDGYIPAQGAGEYSFLYEGLPVDQFSWHALEDIDVHGVSTFHFFK